ncbi:hypothetical protein PMAYCL1PPCAC_05464, partial [Pristionchus mayeri]
MFAKDRYLPTNDSPEGVDRLLRRRWIVHRLLKRAREPSGIVPVHTVVSFLHVASLPESVLINVEISLNSLAQSRRDIFERFEHHGHELLEAETRCLQHLGGVPSRRNGLLAQDETGMIRSRTTTVNHCHAQSAHVVRDQAEGVVDVTRARIAASSVLLVRNL